MSKEKSGNSELILNADGSVYHLNLLPEHIAPTVIVVGDQGRVQVVSDMFDEVEYRITNREFCTHTGCYNGKRITVLSTGIGTDNIDIVLNELDAAVNMNLKTGAVLPDHTSLDIIRLGTSGSLRKQIETGSFLVSKAVVGMDGLLQFYGVSGSDREKQLADHFIQHLELSNDLPKPYARYASPELVERIQGDHPGGITVTAPGFYAPQGRSLRLPVWDSSFHEKLRSFEFEGSFITNFEMETSALYGLGTALGHRTASVCAVIANRESRAFLADYKPAVKRMIREMLDKLTGNV